MMKRLSILLCLLTALVLPAGAGMQINQLTGFSARQQVAFSPSDIANLEVWVRSDLGVTGDPVTVWADQSGNGNDFTESSNPPDFVADQINGHAILRFDGTDDQMITADFSLSQPHHWFIVFKNVSATTNDMTFQTDNDGNPGGQAAQLQNSTGPVMRQSSWAVATGNDVSTDTTDYHYYGLLYDNTNSSQQIDGGTPEGATTINATAFDGIALATGIGTRFANVDIAEIIIYSATISGDNLTNLNSYLATRYGI